MNNQQWYAIVDIKTGETTSFGTEIAPDDVLKAKGLIAVLIPHRSDGCSRCANPLLPPPHDTDAPRQDEVWDPKERAIVPAPEQKIIKP